MKIRYISSLSLFILVNNNFRFVKYIHVIFDSFSFHFYYVYLIAYYLQYFNSYNKFISKLKAYVLFEIFFNIFNK